ncbi:MAG: lipoyl(octanoyl) transferase LipB [Pseudomonadota bacterium]
MNTHSIIIRNFSQPIAYLPCWQAMKRFTDQRTEDTTDEIWTLEHQPVFTQGQNGKPEHVLNPGDTPVIKTDRGGQVTYHGPGQLVIYTLVDVKRKKLNVRELVTILEQSVIQLLASQQISASAQCTAPGVYVNDKKICSVGLRIRRGCAYHGLALNVAMDLSPFTQINPCGFPNLAMTQLQSLQPLIDTGAVRNKLIEYLTTNLRYTTREFSLETLYAT